MKTRILLVGLFAAACVIQADGQGFVNKLKQKADEAATKALEKKAKEKVGIEDDTNHPSGQQNESTSESRSRPTNKGGGGLVATPPDVNRNLAEAEASYRGGSYGDARYAVQQAMLGVEMEIGKKVLESLPSSVSGLDKVAESDQVTSSGYGWVGLTIQREYLKGDKQLTTTVANNSAMMAAVNMFMASGGYSQTTNGEQNWKQTKVKGHRAVIEYSDHSGYKLSVPLGQTSLIMFEGINFGSEQEMMSAAESFDIDGIKKMLGEK